MNFGQVLKEERKKANRISQKDLASLSDVSRSYLSDVENNRYKPSVNFIEKISHGIAKHIQLNDDEQISLYNKLMHSANYGSKNDIESWQTVFNNHKMNLALLENLNDNEVYSIIETTKKEVAKIIEMINNNAEINLDDIKSELESLETGLDEYELSKHEQSETLILNIESNKRAIRLAENKLRELGAETTNKPQSN